MIFRTVKDFQVESQLSNIKFFLNNKILNEQLNNFIVYCIITYLKPYVCTIPAFPKEFPDFSELEPVPDDLTILVHLNTSESGIFSEVSRNKQQTWQIFI